MRKALWRPADGGHRGDFWQVAADFFPEGAPGPEKRAFSPHELGIPVFRAVRYRPSPVGEGSGAVRSEASGQAAWASGSASHCVPLARSRMARRML